MKYLNLLFAKLTYDIRGKIKFWIFTFCFFSLLFLDSCTQKTKTKKNYCAFSAVTHDSNQRKKIVKCVCKDSNDKIIGIGGDWGSKSADEAIADIEQGLVEYFVMNGNNETPIVVMKYLRSTSNKTKIDNLDKLPSCKRFFSDKKHTPTK